MLRNLMIAALAANCLVVPLAAQVQPVSLALKLDGLDLGRTRDILRLDHRIARAAATVCRPESTLDLQSVNAAIQCTRDTIDATRQQRDRAVAKFAINRK